MPVWLVVLVVCSLILLPLVGYWAGSTGKAWRGYVDGWNACAEHANELLERDPYLSGYADGWQAAVELDAADA